jgi:hypothetical protein
MVMNLDGYADVIGDKEVDEIHGFKNEDGMFVEYYSQYKVNKEGIVIDRHNMPLHPGIGDAHEMVNLLCDYKNPDGSDKTKSYAVHRLVALAFIRNPNKCKNVRHINGNSYNVNNLEWCNDKETSVRNQGKKVYRLLPTDKSFDKEYHSMVEAYADNNMTRNGNTLKNACNSGKLLWKYYWSFTDPRVNI